jgi:hypothetical protein
MSAGASTLAGLPFTVSVYFIRVLPGVLAGGAARL